VLNSFVGPTPATGISVQGPNQHAVHISSGKEDNGSGLTFASDSFAKGLASGWS